MAAGGRRDDVVLKFAARVLRANDKIVVFCQKLGPGSEILEIDVRKIAKGGFCWRHLHGGLVM